MKMDRKYVSNHYLDFGSVNFGLPDLIGIWKVEENLDVLTENSQIRNMQRPNYLKNGTQLRAL